MTFNGSDMAECLVYSLLAGVALGIVVGGLMGLNKSHRDAVKAGVARYVAVEDGSSKFEWIVPLEKKP